MNDNLGDSVAEAEIRDEIHGDAGPLSELFGQLGYPVTENELSSRLTALRGNPDYIVRVAEKAGQVIGMIAFHREWALLQSTCEVRVMALVVAKQARGQGMGSRLLIEAENWAREQKAAYIRLNSGIREERSAAHVFYLSHDYNSGSIGFSKKIYSKSE